MSESAVETQEQEEHLSVVAFERGEEDHTERDR
jgi:hypothetical protein